MILTETAFAKINLALHVRQRRADGYHELETLFAFLDAGDVLSVAPSDQITLSITGPFAPDLAADDDNLVLRAARSLASRNGIAKGAAFTLDKRLPVASGIGGGSADAAAALRLAARLWDLPLAQAGLDQIAPELGADVPACVLSRTCFGTGVGEQLAPLSPADVAGQAVLLVNPRVACPTGPVFRHWDGVDRGALDPLDWREARNDLAAPAMALVPAIGAVLDRLSASAAQLVRMSGSGATCFALYASAAGRDRAAQALAREEPGWWTMTGALR